jgi:hypothetical protein
VKQQNVNGLPTGRMYKPSFSLHLLLNQINYSSIGLLLLHSDLLNVLMTVIQNENPLVVNRGLYTLHHVLRALSTRRIPAFRHTFEKVAAQLVPHVAAKWMAHMKALIGLVTTTLKLTLTNLFASLYI